MQAFTVTEKQYARHFSKIESQNTTQYRRPHAPASFKPKLRAFENATVHRNASRVRHIDFALALVTKQNEVNALAQTFGKKANADAILWFAYPKTFSKKFKCDFNCDSGWTGMSRQGFERVRQVAVDKNWSALRFCRVD